MHLSIEPSNVTGSAHKYLHIWLDDRYDKDGPHIIVSAASEWEAGDRGILVGMHRHIEDDEAQVNRFPTFNEAMAYVEKLLDA